MSIYGKREMGEGEGKGETVRGREREEKRTVERERGKQLLPLL